MRLQSGHKRGQSLVELAIALPLLLLVLLGIADFGLLLFAHVQVANATREGARAGSLYLSGRFHYTTCYTTTCPAGYGSGPSDPADPTCWPLRDWVQNALVERNHANNGCQAAGYPNPATIHSFGRLSPAECTSAPTTSSGSDCWWLQPITYFGSTTAITGLPTAGEPLQVRVVYRYNLPFLGPLIPVFQNSVLINKTVIMKVQNN